MKLIKGKQYDTSKLHLAYWSGDDNTDGYNVADFFTSDGTYLGEDIDGVEPIFMDDEISNQVQTDVGITIDRELIEKLGLKAAIKEACKNTNVACGANHLCNVNHAALRAHRAGKGIEYYLDLDALDGDCVASLDDDGYVAAWDKLYYYDAIGRARPILNLV